MENNNNINNFNKLDLVENSIGLSHRQNIKYLHQPLARFNASQRAVTSSV